MLRKRGVPLSHSWTSTKRGAQTHLNSASPPRATRSLQSFQLSRSVLTCRCRQMSQRSRRSRHMRRRPRNRSARLRSMTLTHLNLVPPPRVIRFPPMLHFLLFKPFRALWKWWRHMRRRPRDRSARLLTRSMTLWKWWRRLNRRPRLLARRPSGSIQRLAASCLLCRGGPSS